MVSHELFQIYKQYPFSILQLFVVFIISTIISGITDLPLQTHSLLRYGSVAHNEYCIIVEASRLFCVEHNKNVVTITI